MKVRCLILQLRWDWRILIWQRGHAASDLYNYCYSFEITVEPRRSPLQDRQS